MEIKLTTSEIQAILQGCQYTLRLISSSKDYRNIESSEYFSTLNDVVLNAVGLGSPELVIEPKPKPEPEPEPKPTVTIYDFGALLSKHEPPKKQK